MPSVVCGAGMQHILQESNARVMVLKFARLSSDLLAYGAQDGVVRTAEIGQTSTVQHVGHGVFANKCCITVLLKFF